MIDNTNEIPDIKAELQPYNVYRFANDGAFTTALQARCDEAMREKMLNCMSSSTYTNWQNMGKAGMLADADVTIINIYWAEVYYTVAFFYKYLDRLDKAARIGYTETRNEPGGGSRTISGYSGKHAAAFDYMKRADTCMQRAGFNTQDKLKVRGSIHA